MTNDQICRISYNRWERRGIFVCFLIRWERRVFLSVLFFLCKRNRGNCHVDFFPLLIFTSPSLRNLSKCKSRVRVFRVWILESLHSIGIRSRLKLFARTDLFMHAGETRVLQSIPGAIRRVHGASSQSQTGNALRFSTLGFPLGRKAA